jgi:uncharacterized protein (DUF302 family)
MNSGPGPCGPSRNDVGERAARMSVSDIQERYCRMERSTSVETSAMLSALSVRLAAIAGAFSTLSASTCGGAAKSSFGGTMASARKIAFGWILLLSGSTGSLAADDVLTRSSPHPFAATVERIEGAAKKDGFVLFGRLDHSGAAATLGLRMPQSVVLVIGNPRIGTALFTKYPTLAIDLPLKILVWEDQGGQISISFNSAQHLLSIFKRHGLPSSDDLAGQAKKTEGRLTAVIDAAVN